MNDIEKYKELFTPVTEGLPENDDSTHVVFTHKGGEYHGRAFYQNGYWYFVGITYLGDKPIVTHWLDLSKLIRKDKLIATLEAKIALFPDVEPEYMKLSLRGAYDAYFNILNEIKK